MTPLPLDTTSDAWSRQQAALADLGPEGRYRVALELSEAVRAIQLAGIRARHPDWDHRRIVRHLVERQFGIRLPDAT